MSQEELGKTEETLEETSSAELSQSETAEVVESNDEATAESGTTAEETPPTEETPVDETPAEHEAESTDTSGEEITTAEPSEDHTEETPVNETPAEHEAESTDTSGEETTATEPSEDHTEETPVDETPAEHEAESTDTSGEEITTTEPSKDHTKETLADDIDYKYKKHQVYKGVVTKTAPTAVYVDLGDGTEGIVPGRELELMTRKMLESLTPGAEVDVYVVNPHDHKGEIILSVNHALEELDWRKAEEYGKSKGVYDALIGGYNKGGLIVRFGRLRGFVPQSQLAEERIRTMQGETPEQRYGPMVNQAIGVKVMEVDRSRNRLILSERAAMREVRQRRKEALIEELSVGEIRKGIVVSLENFGAFVDVGGAEGLVHLTELAWGHVTHPRQAVNVGDEIDVEIISIDPKAKRIGLSRRRLLGDPWDEIATSMRRGQLVRAQITKLTKFGAFAKLVDNQAVEGLIHISELSDERVTHPKEVVKRGDTVALRIVKIDVKNRRLGLSLKSVNSTEYLDLDWEMAIQDSANLPEEAPVTEVSTEDTPAEAPVVEVPTEDTPVEEPVAEVSTEDTPAEETTEDAPVAEVEETTEDAPVAEAEGTVEETPAEEPVAEDVTEEAPVTEAEETAEESVAEVPTEDTPAEETETQSDD